MTITAAHVTLESVEEAHQNHALVGYSVHWRLGGIRVAQDELQTILETHGLGQFLPDPPRPRKALRRAILAWLRERAGTPASHVEDEMEAVEDAQDEQGGNHHLVRCTHERGWLCFAVVAEAIADFGWSFGTALRVFYHKATQAIYCSTEVTGPPASAEESIQHDRVLTEELFPHWEKYRSLQVAGDLSGMMCQIVGAMDAVQLTDYRGLYGLYFVPYAQKEAVLRAKSMIAALPTNRAHSAYLCALGVLNEAEEKRQLAPSVHDGLMTEVEDLKADLATFLSSAPGTVRPRTVAQRLTRYRRLREKTVMYAELVEFRRETILDEIAQLHRQAEAIVTSSAVADDGEGYQQLKLGIEEGRSLSSTPFPMPEEL